LQQKTIQDIFSAERPYGRINVFDILGRLIPVLIGIYIFFNSFPHTTAIKEITLYLALFFVIILAVTRKTDFTFSTPLTIPFLLFLAWSCIGIFFALNRPNTIHDIYAHYIKYLAVFFILVNFFRTEQQFRILVWIVALSAALFSIGGIIYFYGLTGHPLVDRFGFTEMSINYLGFVTISGLILALGLLFSCNLLLENVFLSVAVLGTSLATLLTQTRGALIALIVSVTIASWRKWKCFLLIGFGLICYLAYSPEFVKERFFIKDRQELIGNYRICINQLSLAVIQDHPIIGIGFGMQTYSDRALLLKYNERVPERYRQPLERLTPCPHNLYLDIAMRVGWVGFSLFMYILAMFFRLAWQTSIRGKTEFTKAWGRLLTACMVSYLIQAFFADAAFGPQAIIFYVILALMTIVWRLNEGKPVQPASCQHEPPLHAQRS
jgi:O-antigen ligase